VDARDKRGHDGAHGIRDRLPICRIRPILILDTHFFDDRARMV